MMTLPEDPEDRDTLEAVARSPVLLCLDDMNRTGIVSRAHSESDFIYGFYIAFIDYVKAKLISALDDDEFSLLEEALDPLEGWLYHYVEVCNAFRGYKTKAEAHPTYVATSAGATPPPVVSYFEPAPARAARLARRVQEDMGLEGMPP